MYQRRPARAASSDRTSTCSTMRRVRERSVTSSPLRHRSWRSVARVRAYCDHRGDRRPRVRPDGSVPSAGRVTTLTRQRGFTAVRRANAMTPGITKGASNRSYRTVDTQDRHEEIRGDPRSHRRAGPRPAKSDHRERRTDRRPPPARVTAERRASTLDLARRGSPPGRGPGPSGPPRSPSVASGRREGRRRSRSTRPAVGPTTRASPITTSRTRSGPAPGSGQPVDHGHLEHARR